MTNKNNWNITSTNTERKIFKIPINNLSKKQAKKNIKRIMEEYKKSDYSYILEYDRKMLLKERKEKLNKINDGL